MIVSKYSLEAVNTECQETWELKTPAHIVVESKLQSIELRYLPMNSKCESETAQV